MPRSYRLKSRIGSSYDFVRHIIRTFFGILAKQSVNARRIESYVSVVFQLGAFGFQIYNEFGEFLHLSGFAKTFSWEIGNEFLFVGKVFTLLTIQIEADRGKKWAESFM